MSHEMTLSEFYRMTRKMSDLELMKEEIRLNNLINDLVAQKAYVEIEIKRRSEAISLA